MKDKHYHLNIYKIVAVVGIFMFTFQNIIASNPNTSLYNTLDSLLRHQKEISGKKEDRIRFIHDALEHEDITTETRYQIYLRLYDEYMAYRFDSAHQYISEAMRIKKEMGDIQAVISCRLKLSHILAVSGLFDKAGSQLDSVEDARQLNKENLLNYYDARNEYYLFLSAQANNTPYFYQYIDSAMHYRQLLVDSYSDDEYLHTFTNAVLLGEQGKVDKAISLLETYLPKLPEGRQYSVMASTLAYFYGKKGLTDRREEYLIRSAISDVRHAIRENNSLRELAALLMEEGKADPAFRYLQASIEDANFYGTRLRNVQNMFLSPQIVGAYNAQRDHSRYMLWALFGTVSLIAVLLIVSRIYRTRLIRRLRKADEDNKETNRMLKEANQRLTTLNSQLGQANEELHSLGHVKEDYIARFFQLGSSFIRSAYEQNNRLNRLVRERKLEELYKELKSQRYLEEISLGFYRQFDEAFLSICPNFVRGVNCLLQEGQQMESKDGRMTTELRILALIRLGITDNQQIADILRSSITTIYTYRSKMKSRAKDKSAFEDDIRKIDN